VLVVVGVKTKAAGIGTVVVVVCREVVASVVVVLIKSPSLAGDILVNAARYNQNCATNNTFVVADGTCN